MGWRALAHAHAVMRASIITRNRGNLVIIESSLERPREFRVQVVFSGSHETHDDDGYVSFDLTHDKTARMIEFILAHCVF